MLFCMLSKEGCVGGSLQGFLWHEGMEVWMRVADARFALSEFYNASGLRNRMGLGGGRVGGGIVNRLESQAAQGTARLNMVHMFSSMSSNNNGLVEKRQVLNKAHCEDKIACAVIMKSTEEYKHWLGEYIGVLATNEDIATIRIVGEELMRGEDGNRAGSERSDCEELGLKRLDVMKEVFITALAKVGNGAVSSILNEYAEEIGAA